MCYDPFHRSNAALSATSLVRRTTSIALATLLTIKRSIAAEIRDYVLSHRVLVQAPQSCFGTAYFSRPSILIFAPRDSCKSVSVSPFLVQLRQGYL